jgi:hypothetical protein
VVTAEEHDSTGSAADRALDDVPGQVSARAYSIASLFTVLFINLLLFLLILLMAAVAVSLEDLDGQLRSR